MAQMLRLVLASQSPRRYDLLFEAGFDFTVEPVKVSEIIDENLTPEAAVLNIAKIKSDAAQRSSKYIKTKGYLILTADTMVVLEGKVLGQPKNIAEAKNFLT